MKRLPKIGITTKRATPAERVAQKRTIGLPKISQKVAPTLPKEGIGVAQKGANIK